MIFLFLFPLLLKCNKWYFLLYNCWSTNVNLCFFYFFLICCYISNVSLLMSDLRNVPVCQNFSIQVTKLFYSSTAYSPKTYINIKKPFKMPATVWKIWLPGTVKCLSSSLRCHRPQALPTCQYIKTSGSGLH